ncbi:hypothetical protein ACQJBY_054736 [Aegilops geniculata]
MSTMFSVTYQFPCIDCCIIKGARCREICLTISQCSTGVLRELLEPGIEGPPPAIQYRGELERYYHWGNKVKLYQHHVNKLFAMFRRRKTHIKYYVCTINKTFAKLGQRMVNYTERKLNDYIDPDYDTLKVRLANSDLQANCCIMLGTDKRAIVTTNWSEFHCLAKIHGDISAFHFKVTTKQCLVLIVHFGRGDYSQQDMYRL